VIYQDVYAALRDFEKPYQAQLSLFDAIPLGQMIKSSEAKLSKFQFGKNRVELYDSISLKNVFS
jgi:hypothetical protein